MSVDFEKIAATRGVLTPEERAALDEWADNAGHIRSGYQAYDETDSDDDCHGDVEFGPLHSTYEDAEKWMKGQEEKGTAPRAWTIYRMNRCVTRQLKVWYIQVGSPAYSSW